MKVKFLKKRQEAGDVKTFFFAKPKGFNYKAGQHLSWKVKLKFADERGPIRPFTLSSSPTEEFLSLTTRLSKSGYKKTLDALKEGEEVEVSQPKGVFALEKEKTKDLQVFLAGGIGITPFRSIIRYAADKNLSLPIQLVYSNKIPEDIVFGKELDKIASDQQNVKVSKTITRPQEAKRPWQGLTGRINADLVKKLINADWKRKTVTFWICGPPGLVDGVEAQLLTSGIPQHQIKTERFSGY